MTLVFRIDGFPAAGANLPKLPFSYNVFASDTFTGGDVADIDGRVIDNGLGGNTALNWGSSPSNSYAITNGKLVRGSYISGISGAALNVGSSDIRMTIGVNNLPSTNAFFDLRKVAPNYGATITDCYRLRVTSTGLVEVQKKAGSTGAEVISTGSYLITQGMSVGLQIVSNKLTLFINDIEQETITDSTPLTGGYFEIYQGNSATLSLSSVIFESVE